MPKTILSEQDKINLKADLALSTETQHELAIKYHVSQGRISQFKQEMQQEIELIAEKALEKVTGEQIKNKDWILRELERDAAKLEGYRSPDAVRARTGVLKLAVEINGQMPPRMQIAIIPVQHVYEGIDVEQL